jgi:hypothetical protein
VLINQLARGLMEEGMLIDQSFVVIPMCMWAAQGKHAGLFYLLLDLSVHGVYYYVLDAASLDAPHFVVAIGIVVFSGVVLW